ncbi:uncharacterized protein LOC128223879 [Mya arenaria]|uniref:uncharacterized protein LOC128223879 n=1 Tax=Mya arenaria TaxID=6604 RepID=UPI0022E6AAD2|nr:uncharacterized protein LOC128223879 [Mya arenaria]
METQNNEMLLKDVPEFGNEIRKEFMLRKNSVFINHGSYGTIPKCVHAQKIRYLEEMESHPDVWYRYTLDKYLKRAVQKVSSFIGVDVGDTFLLQNVTKAINTVLKTFPLRHGDAFLITDLSYCSVKSAAQHVTSLVPGCATHLLNIKFPIQSEDQIVGQYDQFLRAHPEVRLAIIDHITSPTAILMPVKRLVEVCHRHDVTVLIDGAHAPGQLELKIQDIDADFYTGNLHKWVYAPRGCGFLWRNPNRKTEWLRPLITASCHGAGLVEEFAFEGTKDDSSYLCAVNGIDFYNSVGGIDVITTYTKQLREKCVEYLEDLWETSRLPVPESMVAPNLQMVQLPYIPKFSERPDMYGDLQKLILDQFDIQTYIHTVNGQLYARVSTQIYNTFDDYVKLGNAILNIAREE